MATAAAALVADDDSVALTKRLKMAEVLSAKAAILKSEGKIQGIQKIEKQIKAEIAMLKKVYIQQLDTFIDYAVVFITVFLSTPIQLLDGKIQVKKHHVNSTNLLHLESILHICEYATGVTSVDRAMRHTNGIIQQLTTIDVISNGGSMWIKLFARKRSALHKKWQGVLNLLFLRSIITYQHCLNLPIITYFIYSSGDGNFGEKTVSDFAEDYLQASKQNLHNFLPPKITFVFFDGVTESIAGLHA